MNVHLRAGLIKPKSLQISVSKKDLSVESFFGSVRTSYSPIFGPLVFHRCSQRLLKSLFGLVKSFEEGFCGRAIPSKQLYEKRGVRTIFRVVCNLPRACQQ